MKWAGDPLILISLLGVSSIGKDKTHINILVIGHVDHHWPSDLQAIREVDGGGAGVPGGAALDTPGAAEVPWARDKTCIDIVVIGDVDHHWPSDLQAWRNNLRKEYREKHPDVRHVFVVSALVPFRHLSASVLCCLFELLLR